MQSWESFGHELDYNYWPSKKEFWWTIWHLCGKRSHTILLNYWRLK